MMHATTPTIGFATSADVAEIAELSRTLVEYGLGWKYTPARLRRLLQHQSKNVVVARRQAELAGFGIMTYSDSTANLDLLAVKPRYRHRRVGSQIVAWLSKVAADAGIENVFVQVRKLNPGAIAFYQRIGFQIIDEQARYYHGRESAVILCAPTDSLMGQ